MNRISLSITYYNIGIGVINIKTLYKLKSKDIYLYLESIRGFHAVTLMHSSAFASLIVSFLRILQNHHRNKFPYFTFASQIRRRANISMLTNESRLMITEEKQNKTKSRFPHNQYKITRRSIIVTSVSIKNSNLPLTKTCTMYFVQ